MNQRHVDALCEINQQTPCAYSETTGWHVGKLANEARRYKLCFHTHATTMHGSDSQTDRTAPEMRPATFGGEQSLAQIHVTPSDIRKSLRKPSTANSNGRLII